MKLSFGSRRFRLQPSFLMGALILCVGLFATLIAIRGVTTLKTPDQDYGRYMIRHMRYTFAEVAALDSLLQTLGLNPSDPTAHKMLSNAADHLYIRLQMLSGLKSGPISDPQSHVAPLATRLMEGLDNLVAAGPPIDPKTLAELRQVSSAMLRETGDYTRKVETHIDQMLEQKEELTSTVWLEVSGSVSLLLLLSTIALGLFLRNRRIVHQLKVANGRDSLTGLANRRGFSEWMTRVAASQPTRRYALIVFDLDRFKVVNDQLGHATGDLMLKAAAACLIDTFGARGIVARWGGDEFVAAMAVGSDELAELELELKALTTTPPFIPLNGENVPIRFSCGIALWPEDAPTLDEALTRADAALYEAKGNGRGRYSFYHDDITARRKRAEEIRADLGRALSDGELFLEFQPQVCVEQNRYVGAEALLRWRCSRTNRILSPDEFIPIAEESDQIWDIDTFVLNEACRAAADWARHHQDLGQELGRIAVNLSPHSFQRLGLAAHILSILNRWELPPTALEIEITEGVLLTDSEQLAANLADITKLGIRIALDDFGTGYSNIAYLARLKPDVLKIDRSFLKEANPHTRAAIIKGIIQLGSMLGAETLVEGVETPDDLHFVKEAGCHLVQGYLFARPMAAKRIPEFRRRFLGAEEPVDESLALMALTRARHGSAAAV